MTYNFLASGFFYYQQRNERIKCKTLHFNQRNIIIFASYKTTHTLPCDQSTMGGFIVTQTDKRMAFFSFIFWTILNYSLSSIRKNVIEYFKLPFLLPSDPWANQAMSWSKCRIFCASSCRTKMLLYSTLPSYLLNISRNCVLKVKEKNQIY